MKIIENIVKDDAILARRMSALPFTGGNRFEALAATLKPTSTCF
jgi:hypothetical protein